MGQHTWFVKDKANYLKLQELNKKLYAFEIDEIYLDELELLQLNHEADELYEQNKTEYHDVFRTNKRKSNDTYIDDVIFSRKECFDYISNEENKVNFRWTVFEPEDAHKEEAIHRQTHRLNATVYRTPF